MKTQNLGIGTKGVGKDDLTLEIQKWEKFRCFDMVKDYCDKVISKLLRFKK